MKITPDFRKGIVDEFRSVAKRIREEEDPARKLFFFSATYGIISRVFNFSFDPQLVFIHMVLNECYNTISASVSVQRGEERPIRVPEELFDKLANATDELADKIENDEDTCETLQKIANIAFSTTGNGYYLYEKGLLSI